MLAVKSRVSNGAETVLVLNTRNPSHTGEKVAAEPIMSLSRSLGFVVQPEETLRNSLEARLPFRLWARADRGSYPPPIAPFLHPCIHIHMQWTLMPLCPWSLT